MLRKRIVSTLRKYKRPALILFVVWTIAGISFGGIFALIGNTRNESIVTILTGNLARYYGWGLFSPVVYVFARRFSVLKPRSRWLNGALNLLFGIAISICYAVIFIILGTWFEDGNSSESQTLWYALAQQLSPASFYTVISFYLPTVLTVHALLFFQNYESEESKNAALRAELSRAQLSALKMQLNPHFLFNSLHSVSSLILVDPARANQMVALIGDFLRQTLEHSSEQIVTLEEELMFLRCYLEIEQTRFEDRLSVEFDIESGTEGAGIPHMILQPIVENAVKHGIAPYALPGKITLKAGKQSTTLMLQIRNTGPSANKNISESVNTENGLGIANVRLRLGHLYGNAAKLEIVDLPEGGCEVTLAIPFDTEFKPAAQEEENDR